MEGLFGQWQAMAGCAALIALIVNILKVAKVVKDETAGYWVTGLNILGLAGLFALKLWKPDVDIPGLDNTILGIAQALTALMSVILQVLGSYGVHKLVSTLKLPVIGASYSASSWE